MKVLVIGSVKFSRKCSSWCLITFTHLFSATGMIGRPIAQALSRAGHIVYGQTRSVSKAKQVSAGESLSHQFIHPTLLILILIRSNTSGR